MYSEEDFKAEKAATYNDANSPSEVLSFATFVDDISEKVELL
jgi:hypothetical protein